MLRRFEKVLNPTEQPERPEPPAGLLAFYWHFGRQVKGLLAALFVIELFVALLDTAVPWFMGRIVTFVTQVPPERFLAETWPWLVGMTLTVLIARPAIILARYLVTNQAIAGSLEISAWTVSTHLRRIYAKLAVSSRAEMVAHLLGSAEYASLVDAPQDHHAPLRARQT